MLSSWAIVGYLDIVILLTLLGLTIFIMICCSKLIKQKYLNAAIIVLLTTVFVYSGAGIAYSNVPNDFAYKYIIYIICLVSPFVLMGRKYSSNQKELSSLDKYIFNHYGLIKKFAIIYLILLFIPLIYPDFKLFDIFIKFNVSSSEDHSAKLLYSSNIVIGIINAFANFFKPFFYIYLILLCTKNKSNKQAVVLFIVFFLFQYMKTLYLGRYQILVFLLQLLILSYCIKGYQLQITKKQLLFFGAIFVSLIPFLYAYTYFRLGITVDDVSINTAATLLISSEIWYPTYYEHIVTDSSFLSQTPLMFVLWIIFLPIPSFLWPDKPTVESDVFTQSITGMSYSDANYSSLLPSAMGEGLMFFGSNFYWVHALIVGWVFASLLRYLSQNKTLVFFTIQYIIMAFTYGRGGAMSFIAPLINGCISIILFDKIYRRSK